MKMNNPKANFILSSQIANRNSLFDILKILLKSQIEIPCSIFSRFFSNCKSKFLVHYSSNSFSIDVPHSIFKKR